MGRLELEIEVEYYLVGPGSIHDLANEILPNGTYFFLRRSDESLLHYIVGILEAEEKILYVDLINGRSRLWRDEINFEVLEERTYPVPVRIMTTSNILDVSIDFFPNSQGLLSLNL